MFAESWPSPVNVYVCSNGVAEVPHHSETDSQLLGPVHQMYRTMATDGYILEQIQFRMFVVSFK